MFKGEFTKFYTWFLRNKYIFTHMSNLAKQLSKYMPESAAPTIAKWIVDYRCVFKVSRSRSSKLGDYTAPRKGYPHRISVNHNLNPYAFLITTVHEFAHLVAYEKFGRAIQPHGEEWKNTFRELMTPFFKLDIFPKDLAAALTEYLINPAASSYSDLNLARILRSYDKEQEGKFIECIPEGSYFQISTGRVFQKLNKLRKRYKCVEISSKRVYLFHPLAEVQIIQDIKTRQ